MAMNIITSNKYNDKYNDKYFFLFIVQLLTIYNALKDGWKVKKIGKRKYEFTKSILNNDDKDVEKFLQKITAF